MNNALQKSVLVVHGPNLNLLGGREPNHYGTLTLDDINRQLKEKASSANIHLETFQSNSEVELIDKIQSAKDKIDFILINPAAYTHTSIAMRDALSAVKIPFIEIHLSNIYAREHFRQKSFFSDIAVGLISGLGAMGYLLALDYAISQLNQKA
ncbi:MAG: type II 3-dehydroquinate dehydratase [Candidatus Methylopumilus sp.]|jgi:3-dehydroquinate dehydratase II|nr:type II 3-dehydroquinate dehydratase [Candidatus Methylopumilus sp.]NBW60534.1 type II 3-dehydroquinate dehydratase [Methylophilaceae bacterium]